MLEPACITLSNEDDTIEFLRRADIKVWVLTGDKTGTARSVALASKLIEPSMMELLIDGKQDEEVEESLRSALRAVEENKESTFFYSMVTGDAILIIKQHRRLEAKVSAGRP